MLEALFPSFLLLEKNKKSLSLLKNGRRDKVKWQKNYGIMKTMFKNEKTSGVEKNLEK